jgi:hypothetical protein
MGLEPEITFPDEIEEERPLLKTYALDMETGRIGRFIDGRAAVEQFIRKAILTGRYKHLAYSDEYGCELVDLIGQNYTTGFMQAEIIRVITEALIYDERIERVYDFDVSFKNETVSVFFRVDTIEGTLEISEVFNRV